MVKTNTLTRIIASIALPVIGLVQGCQPLSYPQEQTLYNLTALGVNHQMQQDTNEAIREGGSNVVVSIRNGEGDFNDFIEAKNGWKSRCKILWEDEKFICYRNHDGKYKMLKSDYKRWVYNKY